MAKTDYQTIDEYIATFPPEVQKVLETVRKTIMDAVPGADEAINYQIPAINFHGWVFYISAYKEHYSLSTPPRNGLFEAFKDELAQYKQSKSTFQLPYSEPVPVKLIHDMSVFLADQNLHREA